jgi:MFS family permease
MAVILIEEFKIDYTKVSLLTGYSLCATGAVGIFISALARKYGKRPCILFSVSAAFAGTLWGGYAKSYGSLLGARIVQGLSVAMFESVMFSVIGDLYFVHERGSRMAIYVTSNSGVANLPAMLAGKITTDLGWRWVFWLLAIFLGIAWMLVVGFGWETDYNRNEIYNTDISSQDVSQKQLSLLDLANSE